MKHPLILLLIAGCYITIIAGRCSRPNLTQSLVHIYSTTGKIPVKISNCIYDGTKETYSDITDNCLKAFQAGVFIDKWTDTNKLSDENSPVVLDQYLSSADLVKNEVKLRSGSVCRYDRGFCYDPRESNTYAVVWEILERPKIQCPDELYEVFEGHVDTWSFPQGLSYLFYYNDFADEAFSLRLKSRGQCQETEVLYTEEGYIVSVKPLAAKNIEALQSLKTKIGVKGGAKGGVKGSAKGGRLTILSPQRSYFSLKPKKVVSENILRNCDILSLTLKEVIGEIDSDYLEDSQNLHIILERYYDFIHDTKEDILEIIHRESTLNLTLELKHELTELTQRFEKTLLDIKQIQNTLANAGNIKKIRTDVDNLALEITNIFKKNEEYDKLFEQLSLSIKQHDQALNDKGIELQNLSEKLDKIQNTINVQYPNLITRVEVYDKLNDIEQDFHNKVRELAMNVTLLLLQHQGSGGVRGKGTANAELEQVVLDKLKGFNLDKQQAAIDALKEKTELLINQLSSETYNNVTVLEDRVFKKIADLAAQNKPLLDRLTKVENEMKNLNSLIDHLKSDLEKQEKIYENAVEDFEKKITKIWDKFDDYDKLTSNLKKDLVDISKKEVDFGPVYKKISESIDDSLRPRDSRLNALDDITSKLTESIEKDNLNISSLQKQIDDITQGLKKVDTLKGDITDEFEKEVRPVHTQISALNGAIEEHAKKQTATHEDLQDAKNVINSHLDKLRRHIGEAVDQLNRTLEKNSDTIVKLIDKDNVLSNLIENLSKNFQDHNQSLKKLEIYVKDESAQGESANVKIIQLISNLNENVTELFDSIKNHEGSILELTKKLEKPIHENSPRPNVKASFTKGGVKTSGNKGGVKTYHQYNEDEDGGWTGGKKGKNVQTSVNDNWSDDDGGSYVQTKTTRIYSTSQGHQSSQNDEISTLRNDLAEVMEALRAHEQRIENLEKKVIELNHRNVATDDALTHSIKSLNAKLIETNEKIDYIESDIERKLLKCCSNKSSYTGIKH